MYGKFNEVMNEVKEMSAAAKADNPESTIAVLNLAYSMDRIAKCWVDVADLVKPVHLVAPFQNAS
jgi:uncharacterized protein with PhoU and TrkA domain